jgi:hypothetical protein
MEVRIFILHVTPHVLNARASLWTLLAPRDASGLFECSLGHDFIHHALAANIPGKELLLFQMSRAIRHAPDGSRL